MTLELKPKSLAFALKRGYGLAMPVYSLVLHAVKK